MIRLSLHVGRLDWENVLNELTPRQLHVLMAYTELEPWGDDRHDLRAAVNTQGVMAAMGAKNVDINPLARYLEIHESDAVDAASPDSAAAFMAQAMRGR